jgi:hypothetical protein
LDELKTLLDLGVLSEAEFEAERAKIAPASLAATQRVMAMPEALRAPLPVTLAAPSPAPLPETTPVAVHAPPPYVPEPLPVTAAAPAPTTTATTISLGQTEAQVISILGQPTNLVDLGVKRILIYPYLKITFRDGVVCDVD